MKVLSGRLIGRIKRTPAIESFRFLCEEKLAFIPGQFLEVIFDADNRENKKLNKYLSFSSSPTKEYIEVTKRLSNSLFSQRLKRLSIGERVSFKAPLGSCILKDNYSKIGFLSGGIGITPVISIIEYIVERKLDTNVSLLYSNRTEEDIAFKQELDYWCSLNSNIKVRYAITDSQPKDSTYIPRSIDKDMIKENLSDLGTRILFIFGPPKMVEAMRDLSLELGVSSDNIKTELFIGY